MRSPTLTLLWEIWRRHYIVFAVVIAMTAVGRVIGVPSDTDDSSVIVEILRLVSFVLLFGAFSYTESSDSRALGCFPQRLFVLPVSSVRLTAIPMFAGVASVGLLYLLWTVSFPIRDSTTIAFDALLLCALMTWSQGAIWTLDALGPLRLVIVGLLAVLAFWIDLLPSLPPSPPAWWRSEGALASLVVATALIVFVGAWRHIVRLRSGGRGHGAAAQTFVTALTSVLPRRHRGFQSPTAAHFWFEWRCSGLVLPLLLAGVLTMVVAPLSWLMRHDADDTLRLLIGTLEIPVLLAMAVGIGFGKPAFWSEDLTVPAFIAVRPLSDEEIVAIKVRVAAVSVACSWLLLLSFVAVWLALWGNVDAVTRVARQVSAVYDHSVIALYGAGGVIVIAEMLLTWRFLVSRLWSGLSGRRTLFLGSTIFFGLAVVGGLLFDATRLPRWMLEDSAHMKAVVDIATVALIVKFCLAVYSWRAVSPRYMRRYLLAWIAGTAAFGWLAYVVSGIVQLYVALDGGVFQSLLILLTLLALPLARVGIAPASLARNRHR